MNAPLEDARLFVTTAEVAAALEAHELWPTCSKGGDTMWTCKTCDDVSIPGHEQRHSPAQAEHQAAMLAAMQVTA